MFAIFVPFRRFRHRRQIVCAERHDRAAAPDVQRALTQTLDVQIHRVLKRHGRERETLLAQAVEKGVEVHIIREIRRGLVRRAPPVPRDIGAVVLRSAARLRRFFRLFRRFGRQYFCLTYSEATSTESSMASARTIASGSDTSHSCHASSMPRSNCPSSLFLQASKVSKQKNKNIDLPFIVIIN